MSFSLLGKFVDVVGLKYASGDEAGISNPRGEFRYQRNGQVTFLIGSLALATISGKSVATFLDLDETRSLSNPRLLNRARLLLSLTDAQGFERPIVINERIHAIVSKYASQIDLDTENPASLDWILRQLCREAGFALKSIAQVRNHLRRAIAGFKVLRDIQIPVKDGNFVLGDVYLPLTGEGRYPVVIGLTIYGKRVVYSGPDTDDPSDVAAFERAEDEWHSTTSESAISIPHTGQWFGNWSKQRRYETIGTFNTFLWVPKGYVMIKIDPRGVSQTPGCRTVPGQEASDLCDAVEWAAEQPWSTGKVGLVGNSYGANCQWPVMMQKPKGLVCCIPYGTDIDPYRDVTYPGGIPIFTYLRQWYNGVCSASPKWPDRMNLVDLYASHEFFDGFWQKTMRDLSQVEIPVFLASSQMALVHLRGPFEAYRDLGSKDKYLQIVDGDYYGWPSQEVAEKMFLFADRYLKGSQLDGLERVGIQMRLGDGRWYWRTEDAFPLPETVYIKWHFTPEGTLVRSSNGPTSPAKQLSYPANPEPKEGHAGVSFISLPFETDVELAGHFAAKVNISSSSYDADIVVMIWVLDETGEAIRYRVKPAPEPLALGLLRASHRKLDVEKSLPYRPYHTHKEVDYAPLQPGEIATVDVEISPATARIRRGWRLRVDIAPSDEQPSVKGYSPDKFRVWEEQYHAGATNSVHVGRGFENFLLVPVVPVKEPRGSLLRERL